MVASCNCCLTNFSFPSYPPDFALPFELRVDASNTATGMVLAQKQNNREIVIAYASHTLNCSECNYSATERETLAVVEGIQYFQHYLYG